MQKFTFPKHKNQVIEAETLDDAIILLNQKEDVNIKLFPKKENRKKRN